VLNEILVRLREMAASKESAVGRVWRRVGRCQYKVRILQKIRELLALLLSVFAPKNKDYVLMVTSYSLDDRICKLLPPLLVMGKRLSCTNSECCVE
jgi:hypothetical protein